MAEPAGNVLDTLRKGTARYFTISLKVPMGQLATEFTAKMVVDGSNTVIILDIPFPYPNFTEMEFFLSSVDDGRFIPEYYYDRINEKQIRFKKGNPFAITEWDGVRFTFMHKNGFYAVHKHEQTIELVDGKTEYKIKSPYTNKVNLQQRMKVFYDNKLLYPDTSIYTIDSKTGTLRFNYKNLKIGTGHIASILCFYTGTYWSDKTITTLPMSGYIDFDKKHIDRVYDKDLFNVFVNGKLLDRDQLIDISNGTHKISEDIRTRYNVQVRGMSPRIDSLVPYFKKSYEKRVSKQKTHTYEFPVTLKVYYPDKYRPRYYILPDIFNPVEYKRLVPDNLEWYISIIRHGLSDTDKKSNIKYLLHFYRDEYMPDPEPVQIIGQIRLKGNEEEFYPDSPTATLIGTLPDTLTTNMADVALFTIKAKTIFDNDTTFNGMKDSIDGIMCRLKILDTKIDQYHHLYYELESSNYERDAQVDIFEWIISDKPYGEGHIYYRKTINMRPFNNPEEDPDTDDEKEEFLDDEFEPDVDDEDFEPDDI